MAVKKRTLGDDLRDFKAGKAPDGYRDNIKNTTPYAIKSWQHSDGFVGGEGAADNPIYGEVTTSSQNNKTKGVNSFLNSGNQMVNSVQNDFLYNENREYENKYKNYNYEQLKTSYKSAKDDREKNWILNKIKKDSSSEELQNWYDTLSQEYDSKLQQNPDPKISKEFEEKASEYEDLIKNKQRQETAQKNQKKDELYSDFYKDYDYKQLKKESENGRLSDYERQWLRNKANEKATSQQLQNELDKLTSDYDSRLQENPDPKVEQEYEKKASAYEELIDKKKYEEKKKAEYDDVIENNIKAKTIMQKYYNLQKYDEDVMKQPSFQTVQGFENNKGKSELEAYNYAKNLSEEERKQIINDFNSLENKDTLYKYYKREREEQETAEKNQILTDYSEEHPVLGSLASMGLNTYGSIGDTVKYAGAGIDKAFGGDGYINPNSTNVAKAQLMREKVSEDMDGLGKFFYNTGMSIGDNLARMPLLALPGGEAMSLALAGTSAGVSSANDVINSGGSLESALWTGAAAGTAEIVFEKIPLDKLIKLKNEGTEAVWKAVAEQMAVEGIEEGLTDITNAITDQIINGDMSQLALQYQNYIAQGYSEDEARKQIAFDFASQLGQSFAAGAISGGVLSGGTVAINKISGTIEEKSENRKSASQLGREALQSEDFNVNELIKSAKKSDNPKTVNLANSLEKVVDEKGADKVKAVDVGNLLTLTNSDEITYDYSQDLSELTGTDKQNIIDSNFELNGEEKTSKTSDGEVKYTDTKAFGENYPHGLGAKISKTGERITIVGLKSSSKDFNTDDNTVVLLANNGELYDSDDIRTSVPHFNDLFDYAKNFDTIGARVFLSQYEDYAKRSKSRGKTADIAEYSENFERLYSYGAKGVTYDSIKKSGNFTREINILSAGVAYSAVQSGNNDFKVDTRDNSNKSRKIRMPGESNSINSKVYVDPGSEDSVKVTDEQLAILQAVADKTGREIVLTDRMGERTGDENANGGYNPNDGKIYVNAEVHDSYMLSVSLHEAVHGVASDNPAEYHALCTFITNYLVAKGENIDNLLDDIKIKWGDSLRSEDAALEELVCQTVMAIATDEAAIKTALSLEENKGILKKVASALKKIAKAAYDFIKGVGIKAHNKQAQPWINDIEALNELAVRLEKAFESTRTLNEQRASATENTETEQKNNTAGNGEIKYSYLGKTDQGIEVYETSELMKSKSYKEKLKIFKSNFYNENSPHYLGKKIRFQINNRFYFAEIDRFAQNENVEKINPNHLNQWDKAKINLGADGDFVTLLENSIFDKNEKNNNKSKNDAHKRTVSFDYFYKTVFIDRKPFDVIINVRRDTNKQKYVYDVKIKPVNKNKSSQLEPQLIKFNSQRRSKVENTRLSELSDKSYHYGNKMSSKNSVDDVIDENRDLVAVHNLNAKKLAKMISDFDGQGIPAPSIAIDKADNVHSDFGEISLIFDRNTIDPKADRRNSVYSRDAWTSMYPKTEFKLNEKAMKKLAERLDLSVNELKTNMFDTSDIQKIKYRFEDDIKVRKAFLKENNIKATPVLRDRQPDIMMFSARAVKKFVRNNDCTFDRLVNDKEFRNELFKAYSDGASLKGIANAHIKETDEILDLAKSEEFYSVLKEKFDYAIEYAKGNVQQTEGSMSEAVNNAIEEYKEEFDRYIDELLSSGVLGEEYIVRDDVDPYDEYGNRKPFSKTHYKYNIENVVMAMKAGRSKVGSSFSGGVAYVKSIGAKKLGSIDEIKGNKNRIVPMTEEELEAENERISDLIMPLIQEVADSGRYNNDFITASNNIVDAFNSKKDVNGVYSYLKQYHDKIKMNTVKKLFAAKTEIENLPTRYFEAKPHRAVGFDEVKAAVIPADTHEALKGALKELGVPMYEYDSNNENSRAEVTQKAINTEYVDKNGEKRSDLRFSKDDTIDNEYLEAVKNNDIETAQKFVDEAAKENGYTIKAYHGTTNQQEKSTWNDKMKWYDTEYKHFTVFKRQYDEQAGHFFNDDIDNAGGYGSILYSVYLKINKPLVIDCNGQNYASITFDGKEMDTYEWAEYAKKHRYDGVIFKNISDGVGYDDLSRLTTDYVVFESNQIKSSEPITYDDKGNVIPLSKRFNYLVDIRYSKDDTIDSNDKKITAGMSDSERAEILKNKKIENIGVAKKSPLISSWNEIDKLLGKEKQILIQKIAQDFGAFKEYHTLDFDISFSFSNNNYRESYSKQKRNFQQFAKMFSVFDEVIKSAVGIEVHNRNDYYKIDPTLKAVYVMFSAFKDGENIIPVKLVVKEFIDKPNTLYVAVSLDAIKMTEVSKQGTTENGVAQNSRSVTYSIYDLFTKINPKDIDFIKYIPDDLLTKEQLKVKKEYLYKSVKINKEETNSTVISNNVGRDVSEIKLAVDDTIDSADKKITVGMSDSERAEIFKNTVLTLADYEDAKKKVGKTVDTATVISLQDTVRNNAYKILRVLGDKFKVFEKTYKNENVNLEFDYSKGTLKESVNKQGNISTDYSDFAKMLCVFDEIVNNAVPIEVHTDRYAGTERHNPDLKYDYVLLSGFKDKEYIVPVELHIKEYFVREPNKLYVSITLGKTKIEDNVVAVTTEPEKDSVRNTARLSSKVSLPQLIAKINSPYGNFYKYIPDELLNENQLALKAKSLQDEEKKLSDLRKKNIPYSDISEIKLAVDDTIIDYLAEEYGKPKSRADFQKIIEENPNAAILMMYRNSIETAQKGLYLSESIKLPEESYRKIARKVLIDMGVKVNNYGSAVGRLAESIKHIVEKTEEVAKARVVSGPGYFRNLFENFAKACSDYVKLSSRYNENYRKNVRDYVNGLISNNVLVVRDDDIELIKKNYGSVTEFRSRMNGKTKVGMAKNGRTGYYIEDVADWVYKKYPKLVKATRDKDGVWHWIDKDGGFRWFDMLVNDYLEPKFDTRVESSTVKGYYEDRQSAGFEAALNAINCVLREKVKVGVNEKRIERSLVKELDNEAEQSTNELKELKWAKYRIEELRKRNRKLNAELNKGMSAIREEYYEARMKTVERNKLIRKLNKFIKLFENGKSSKNYVPDVLQKPILDVLKMIEMNAGTYKNGKQKSTPKTFDRYTQKVSDIDRAVTELTEKYETLKEKQVSYSSDVEFSLFDINTLGFEEETLEMLKNLQEQVKGKNIYELSAEDLRTIYDTINELDGALKRAVEVIIDGQKTTVQEAALKAVEEIGGLKVKKGGSGIKGTVQMLSNQAAISSLDPERFSRYISGYHDDYVIRKIINELHNGEKKVQRIKQAGYIKVTSVLSKYSNKDVKYLQKGDVVEFDFTDIDTNKRVKVSPSMLMGIYLTVKQEDGLRHIINEDPNSYLSLPDLDLLNKNNPISDLRQDNRRAVESERHRVRLTEDDISHINNYIETNAMLKELCNAIMIVFNEQIATEINNVSLQTQGRKIAVVKNYYPLSVDPDCPKSKSEWEFTSVFKDQRIKNKGFTKNRTYSILPLRIDDAMSVFSKHISETAEYCGLLVPLTNFMKIYRNGSDTDTVKSIIKKTYGEPAIHYINKFIGDLQKSDNTDNNLFLKWQGKYMGAKLLANPGAMIQQFSAFPLANKYFGTKNVAAAATVGFNKIDFDLYAKYTPYLWYRAQGNGTILGEVSKEVGFYKKLTDYLDIMGKVDRLVVGRLLYAAELHVEQTTDLKRGTDAFYKEVVRQFEKCIDETQPNNMVTSKPQFIRNNIMKALSFSAFRSQVMAVGNCIIDSFGEYNARRAEYNEIKTDKAKAAKKESAKNFLKVLIGAANSFVIGAILKCIADIILRHKYDDIKDEKGNITFANIVWKFADESLENLASSFIWGDKLYEIGATMIDHDRYFGLEVMSVEAVNDGVEKAKKGDWFAIAALLIDGFGYPAENMLRYGRSILAYANDISNGYGEIITKNNSIENNTSYFNFIIVEAKQKGETEKAEHFEQLWKDDLINKQGKTEKQANDIIKKKLVTALAASDDDVEQAALAKANGDLKSYEEHMNKVVGYGFDSVDVKKAVDKVIKNFADDIKNRGLEEKSDIISDLKNQGFSDNGAEYVYKSVQSGESSESEDELSAFSDTSEGEGVAYTYSDAFEYLKNGDRENYERIEQYLIDNADKTKKDVQSAMRSASRTDELWKEYFEAQGTLSGGGDPVKLEEYKKILTNIYGSWSTAVTYGRKYQERMKKKEREKNK
ncbi:MAG: hypothetical protein ACI4G0_03605 [Ruminococcus sp.]